MIYQISHLTSQQPCCHRQLELITFSLTTSVGENVRPSVTRKKQQANIIYNPPVLWLQYFQIWFQETRVLSSNNQVLSDPRERGYPAQHFSLQLNNTKHSYN